MWKQDVGMDNLTPFNRIHLVIVIIIISFHFIPVSSIKLPIRTDSFQETSSRIIETGFFSISNTSDQYTLFQETVYATVMHIGTPWELSISVSSNSSSKVAFVLLRQASRWFEGTEAFQVHPNETRSELYVSHCASDETAGFNFRYSLVDNQKDASGNYNITRIHFGYPVDIGSGDTCIWDIAAWLKDYNSSSTVPSVSKSQPLSTNGSTPHSGIIPLSVLGIIFLKRRKNNKNN